MHTYTSKQVVMVFDQVTNPDCLSGHMIIGGEVSLHIMAIAVEKGTTKALNPMYQARVDAIVYVDEGTDYELYSHDGRWYFIIIFPYRR